MIVATVPDQIVEIDRKLDAIAEELAHQRRHRLEMEDLKNDLTIVARDLYQTAVVDLEELSEHVGPGDVGHLLKRVLRNTDNLTRVVDQLESAHDLLQDLQPITKEVYGDALQRLEHLEEKGYFRFARRLGGMTDALVGAHDDADMDQAEASIPQLVGFLREITKPEVLDALGAIVRGFGEVQASEKPDVSLTQLFRELRSPDARRGLFILVTFLKVVGAGADATPDARPQSRV